MNDPRPDLQEVFRDVFDDSELTITDATTAEDVPGWDSLTHINLIIAIERKFGIKFATAEISNLKADGQNIGSLVSLISKKAQGAR